MFTHLHYVPVLRWKSAEQRALLKLTDEIRDKISPLIEIVPRQLEGGKRIETAVKTNRPLLGVEKSIIC